MSRQILVEGKPVYDWRTIFRNPKTGQLEKEQHYVLTIDHRGTRLESPPGSGMIYNTKGELIEDGQAAVRAAKEAEVKAAQEALDKKRAEERAALLAEVEKEKAEIIAQAKAEAASILDEATKPVSKKGA